MRKKVKQFITFIMAITVLVTSIPIGSVQAADVEEKNISVLLADNMSYDGYGDWKKVELIVGSDKYQLKKKDAVEVTFHDGDQVKVIASDKATLWEGACEIFGGEMELNWKESGAYINYSWEFNEDNNLELKRVIIYNGSGVDSVCLAEARYKLDLKAETAEGNKLSEISLRNEWWEGMSSFCGYSVGGNNHDKVYAENGLIYFYSQYDTLQSLGITTSMPPYETDEILGDIYRKAGEEFRTEEVYLKDGDMNTIATITLSLPRTNVIKSGLLPIGDTGYFLAGGEKVEIETANLAPTSSVEMAEGAKDWKVTVTFDNKPVAGMDNADGREYAGTCYITAIKGSVPPAEEHFTVSFDKNGGSYVSEESRSVTQGKTYGTMPTAKRKGYLFQGWYTDKTGGAKITSETIVNLSGNQVLYAHWKKAKKPSKVKISSIKNATKRRAVIKLKKAKNAQGYQILYSTNKKFKSAKKVTSSSLKKTISGLKKGKTYYVKVRAYNVDSTDKKIYGNYSKVVKVKIKK